MTIVRYDPHSEAKDRYPREIISPPSPGACCLREMKRTGKMEPGEGGWPYFYKRCQICGYTVREFLGTVELGDLLLTKRRGHSSGLTRRSWLGRVFSK